MIPRLGEKYEIDIETIIRSFLKKQKVISSTNPGKSEPIERIIPGR